MQSKRRGIPDFGLNTDLSKLHFNSEVTPIHRDDWSHTSVPKAVLNNDHQSAHSWQHQQHRQHPEGVDAKIHSPCEVISIKPNAKGWTCQRVHHLDAIQEVEKDLKNMDKSPKFAQKVASLHDPIQ